MKSMNTRHPLPRRGFLLAAALSVTVAGCGFELRKAPVFPFKTLVVQGSSAFTNSVRRNLRAAGNVELLPADQAAKADAVLEILAENREQLVTSTNSAGQVREIQLRLTVRFRLRGQAGKELLAPTAITQTRDITYNETAALAKASETELLYVDMQNDIAQQMMRRLAAVKAS
ncbi:Rare lipoprotein B [Variovorax sp. PBL-E5]|nr:Rare lipoprotein B [Variovorax sp. PBL-E5]